MFQFLIGNVLANMEDLIESVRIGIVSIPYRQCLSSSTAVGRCLRTSRVSIPYRQCLSSTERGPWYVEGDIEFQFLIGNVLAWIETSTKWMEESKFQFLIGNVLAM